MLNRILGDFVSCSNNEGRLVQVYTYLQIKFTLSSYILSCNKWNYSLFLIILITLIFTNDLLDGLKKSKAADLFNHDQVVE